MSTIVKRDPLDVAKAAWGDEMPAWVEALAREASQTTSAAASERIGYSGAVVSSVLANKYKGRLDKVEARVRGALMGETVNCPEQGEISRNRCIDDQGREFSTSSPHRVRIYRACRNNCPHSRIGSARP